MCNARGLSDEGTKDVLIIRLIENSKLIQEISEKQNLHELKEINKPKKWRDVHINSLA